MEPNNSPKGEKPLEPSNNPEITEKRSNTANSPKPFENINRSDENFCEYLLPYGWKKVGKKRCLSQKLRPGFWDWILFSPDGKKFRSTIQVQRYLQGNPDVKCDISVTNTSTPDDLTKKNIKISEP